MCRFRHKTVFLILIINSCAILATEKYNADSELIKCCDDDDKDNGYPLNSGNSDTDNNTTSVELPIVLNRFRFDESITKPNSSCIRIMLQSFLVAPYSQSLPDLKIDQSEIDETTHNAEENSSNQYVLYCNNTTVEFIDDFISKSSGDKSATKGQSNDGNGHSDGNELVLSAIILINVSSNGDNIKSNQFASAQRSWHSTVSSQRNFGVYNSVDKNATVYLSWTSSHLNSELFSAWAQSPAFPHLTHLDISNNDISNLTWGMFESLPALRSLNLSLNAISNENFQYKLFHRFRQLQQLDLSNNKIMSIVHERLHKSAPMSSESSTNINSNQNHQTSALPMTPHAAGVFSEMPELRELILSHNQITDLPRNSFVPNGLAKLHFLNLAHNNLSIIPFQIFQSLSALKELDLSSNRLVTFLDNFFIQNEALTVLNLQNNTLQRILTNSLQGLSNLIELDLSDNQIAYIDRSAFDSLKALQRLNLCRNNLNELPTTLFYRLHQLKYLNLSRNKFKILPNGIFASQYALEHLIIDETPLQKLNNWVSRQPDEVKKDVLKRLRTISMRKNRHLREIDAVTLRSLQAVEHLNLSGNGLIILPHEIGEMIELKHLDISKNDLISIPRQLNTLPNLDTINMIGNSFECDCQMFWLTAWIDEKKKQAINTTLLEQQPPFNQMNELKCHHGYPGEFLRVLQQLQCYRPTAVHVSESKTHLLRSDAQLECSFSGNPVPDIIWVTPLNKVIRYYADPDAKPLASMHRNSMMNGSENNQINADLNHQAKSREKMEHQILKHKHFEGFTAPTAANEVTLLENGSLRVHNISRKDSGLYICYGYNVMGYESAEIRYVNNGFVFI